MKNIKILLLSQLILLCLVGWVGFTLAVLTGRSDKTELDSSMIVDDANSLVVLCLHKLSDSKIMSIGLDLGVYPDDDEGIKAYR